MPEGRNHLLQWFSHIFEAIVFLVLYLAPTGILCKILICELSKNRGTKSSEPRVVVLGANHCFYISLFLFFLSFCFCLFVCFASFLGLHLAHMEVPRLGVESEP